MPRFKVETEEKVHGVYYVEAADEQAARDLFEQGSVQPPEIFESLDAEITGVEEVPMDWSRTRPKYENRTTVKVEGEDTLYEIASNSCHRVTGWQYALTRAGEPPSTGAHPRNPIPEAQVTPV